MAGGGINENIVSDEYIILYNWIHQYLKLNGNEAETFALIYSFYQKEGFYGGSAGYISKRLCIPFRTAQRILNKLEEYKYIAKEKGDFKARNRYFINVEYITSLVPFLNLGQNVSSSNSELTTKCRKGIRQNDVRDTTKCRTSIKYSIKDSNNNIFTQPKVDASIYTQNKKDDANLSTNQKSKPSSDKKMQEQKFSKFWEIYPRKKDKARAFKTWLKLKPNDELFNIIMTAVKEQAQSDQWQKDNGQYIPYPSTWLNNERWNDETKKVADINSSQNKDEEYVPVRDFKSIY